MKVTIKSEFYCLEQKLHPTLSLVYHTPISLHCAQSCSSEKIKHFHLYRSFTLTDSNSFVVFQNFLLSGTSFSSKLA